MDEAEVVAAVGAAEERTRLRLAQLLHDDLQQHLHSLRVRIGMLGDQLEQGEEATAAVAELARRVDDAVEALRRITRDLTSVDEPTVDLAQGLAKVVTTVSDLHGLHVEVRDERSTTALDRSIVQLLVDATRELLFNVVKHAGVDRAEVAVVADEATHEATHGDTLGDTVVLTVTDRGESVPDAPSDPTGLGIAALRDRVETVGGRLDVHTPATGGTSVVVRVPIRPSDRTDLDQSEDTASLT